MKPWLSISLVLLVVALVVLGGEVLYYKPKKIGGNVPSKVKNLIYTWNKTTNGTISWDNPDIGGPTFEYLYTIKDGDKILQNGEVSTKNGDSNIVHVLSSLIKAKDYKFSIIPKNDVGNGPTSTLVFHIWITPRVLEILPLIGDSVFVDDGKGQYMVQMVIKTDDEISDPSTGIEAFFLYDEKNRLPSSVGPLKNFEYKIEWNSLETRVSPNTMIKVDITTKNVAGSSHIQKDFMSPKHKSLPGIASNLRIKY